MPFQLPALKQSYAVSLSNHNETHVEVWIKQQHSWLVQGSHTELFMMTSTDLLQCVAINVY